MRLKGGELLLDITSYGDLKNGITLNEKDFKPIKELTNATESVFTDLPKIMWIKCIVNNSLVFAKVYGVADDNSYLLCNVIIANSIYTCNIQINGDITAEIL